MIVGIINKRFSNSKLIGTVVNYSLLKGDITIKVFLDANKKRLIVYSPSNPNGELFTDLPKDGLFYPAIQNKSDLKKKQLKVQFKFEMSVPKDKTQIQYMGFGDSDEEEEELDEQPAPSRTASEHDLKTKYLKNEECDGTGDSFVDADDLSEAG